MTRFSPPIIHQCPECAGYFARHALISLHFDDHAPEWSDGKSGQWWAGASGHVGRCPACSRTVWIADAEEVMRLPWKPSAMGAVTRLWHRMTGDRDGRIRDEREWDSLPAGVKSAERIDGLRTARDFIEALATNPPDALEREVHLRLRLWWESNDHLRQRTADKPLATEPAMADADAHTNILRLLVLVESDPNRQVERGELLRQLGRFGEAVAVLKAVKPNGYSEVKASKIQRLAMAGNSRLQAIGRGQAKDVVW